MLHLTCHVTNFAYPMIKMIIKKSKNTDFLTQITLKCNEKEIKLAGNQFLFIFVCKFLVV
jgi:hypothetical protein